MAESVEELNYAAEIAAAEAYEIWNVKVNTPGIGRIAKSILKRRTGASDLPQFEETKSMIKGVSGKIYSFLDYVGFLPKGNISRKEAGKRYQQKMKSYGKFTDSRRLKAYDLDEGVESPKNASENKKDFERETIEEYNAMEHSEDGISFREFKRKKENKRKLEAIRSPYNSWWEKMVGYIFYFLRL